MIAYLGFSITRLVDPKVHLDIPQVRRFNKVPGPRSVDTDKDHTAYRHRVGALMSDAKCLEIFSQVDMGERIPSN